MADPSVSLCEGVSCIFHQQGRTPGTADHHADNSLPLLLRWRPGCRGAGPAGQLHKHASAVRHQL